MILEPIPQPELKAPGCQDCGRSDETVRAVSYPFVFSVLILTFRRSFDGLWCARHRAVWKILAAVTSLTFGWMGIPLGVVFTPLVLAQLARGGVMPPGANGRILRAIAQDRLRKGDMAGARRCLEESLSFESDPLAEDQLKRLAAGLAIDHPAGRDDMPLLWALVVSAALLAASALGGLTFGALGMIFATLLQKAFGEVTNAFQLLLYLMPRLLAAGLGVFALQAGLGAALRLSKAERAGGALALGGAAGALFGYCVLSGSALVEGWGTLVPSGGVVPLNRVLYDTALVILRGPILVIQNSLAEPGLLAFASEVFAALVIAFALFAALHAARGWAAWRGRVNALVSSQVSASTEGAGQASLGAAVASLAAVAAFAGAALLAPQQAFIDDFQAQQRYSEGLTLFYNDQNGPAVVAFEDAVRLNPSFAKAYAALARAYLGNGDAEKAEETARLAVSRFPDDSQAHWAMGWVLYYNEQYEDAHHEMQRAVEIDPNNHTAHAMLGWIDRARYEYAEAKGHFSDAIKLDDDGEYYVGQGIAQYWLNEYDDAIRSLHDGINRGYDDETTRMTLLYAYLYSGKFEKLVEQSRDAAKVLPDSPLVPAMMATAYYHLGNAQACDDQVKLALERLHKSQNEGDPQGLLWILMDIHRLDDVERETAALLDGAEGCGAYCALLAGLAAERGEFEQGIGYAQQVDTKDNSHAWASNLRADVMIQKGDWSGAADAAELALTYADPYENAMVNLATAAYYLGDTGTALEQARAVLELDPYSAGANVMMAYALRAQGHTDEAIEAARRALAILPGDDEAHYILGMSLLDAGKQDEAKAELEQFQKFYWPRPYGERLKAEAEQALRKMK